MIDILIQTHKLLIIICNVQRLIWKSLPPSVLFSSSQPSLIFIIISFSQLSNNNVTDQEAEKNSDKNKTNIYYTFMISKLQPVCLH